MASGRSVRLLVVHETQNAAEEIANLLRNSGLPTQMTFIASGSEFEQKLSQSQWDLILVRNGLEILPTDNAIAVAKQAAPQSPIIVLVDELDDMQCGQWFKRGASDVCEEEYDAILLNRMRFYIESFHSKLDIAELSVQLEETEQRCQSMLRSSKDAIAYVHGGMHIFYYIG